MIRSEKGTFVKKSKPLIPTIEFTRGERKALARVREDGLSEYMAMFMSMLRLAQYEPSEDEDPNIIKAKIMAKVKAAEWVRLSALGKPASSEQDLDRITTQPVKTIIVVSPDLMNPKVVDADQAVVKPKQPSFAEVLGVITNEKKK
jgi:hypothetical protein